MRLVFSKDAMNTLPIERTLFLDKIGLAVPPDFEQERPLSVIALQTLLANDGG